MWRRGRGEPKKTLKTALPVVVVKTIEEADDLVMLFGSRTYDSNAGLHDGGYKVAQFGGTLEALSELKVKMDEQIGRMGGGCIK